ncbi:MAG: hypothetical protein WDN23_12760 [Edaphobacter sp.]
MTETKTETKPKRYQCRHIFADGHRCGSICLRREELCYYHHTTRKPAPNPRARRARRGTFDLPLNDPNDRTALQSTIVEVLHGIAANDIDPRRAGLLLYGLQIASLNLPKTQTTPRSRKTETIEEITTHPDLGILAPKTDIDEIPLNPKSAFGLLLEAITKNTDKPKQQTTEDTSKNAAISTEPRVSAENRGDNGETCSSGAQSLEPTILPTIQAAEETLNPNRGRTERRCHPERTLNERSESKGQSKRAAFAVALSSRGAAFNVRSVGLAFSCRDDTPMTME